MAEKKEKPTKQLGKYTLHEELGRGGFATVYRATHGTLGTEAAVKVLSPSLAADEKARQRFIQEAQTASALEHPHIVRILDLDENADQVFIAMEYLPGGDLKQRIEKQGALGEGEALGILRQVAEALDYAHVRGVVHRDVKPSNILFDQKGAARVPRKASPGASRDTVRAANTGGTPVRDGNECFTLFLFKTPTFCYLLAAAGYSALPLAAARSA